LSLVVWTVVITANTELETMDGSNSTNATNASLNLQLCTFNSSEPLEQVKLSLVRDNVTSITRKNFIHRAKGKMTPLCKCFCRFNISEEQLIEAIKFIKWNQTMPIPLLQQQQVQAANNAKLNKKVGLTTDQGAAPPPIT